MRMSLSTFPGPINGPYVQSPAFKAEDGHALICLHGFGSSGDDLITLAPALFTTLGNVAESLAIYSPHAPTVTPMGQGRQWFRDMGWTFRDPEGLARITQDLDNFLGHVMEQLHIPAKNIAFLGFSQGAMTILHALPTLTNQPGGVIACCGTISVPPTFPAGASNPAPILFIHGQDDDVLPADRSVEASALFQSHGHPTELHILPNLGHGLDATALAHIAVFLQNLWPTS